MSKTYFLPVLILITALGFQSCSVTRNVPDGEVLLNDISIKISDDNLRSELSTLVRQRENRKILWIYRFRLRFYSSFLFKKNSDSKIRKAMGEPPVIFDSSLAASTTLQMEAYLRNKGYYDNEVTYETEQKKWNKKKLKLIFNVRLGTPTLIAGMNYDIKDTSILVQIASSQPQSLIKPGDNLDIDVLEEERKRIARYMQNRGYFFFTSDLVTYFADTLRIKKKAVILIKVKPDPVKFFNDSIRVNPYETYNVRNIYVKQDFVKRRKPVELGDTITESGYQYISSQNFTVKPKVLSRSIFLKSDYRYELEDHENTYRRLSALNNYKYINISYVKTPGSDSNNLNCVINLSPSVPLSIGVELNGTNTGGNPGVNASFSVQNKNLLRGAEILRFRLFSGIEVQNVQVTEQKIIRNTPFNTYEIGPELTLTIPKFMFPIDHSLFPKRVIPTTIMTVSYNFQERPDYTRSIVNASLGYSWRESKTKTHTIQPWNLSQIKIDKSELFQRRLDSINNTSLSASYEDNVITSVIYNFVYNDQALKGESSFNIFRGNLELAGNVVSLVDKYVLNTTPDENGQYLFNNIPYAQFVRAYVEYVRNFRISRPANLVTRTFIGAGIPYGNSNVMPFVRRFFGGGTNGIRAWQSRNLGPGSLSNEDLNEQSIDQIGDIKLEQNLEYRFRIIRFFEGALFTDLGNIWVLNDDSYEESAQFNTSNLWRDLAVGMGVGARLNFNFFVIRLDVAKRVKDPGAANPYSIRFFYPNPAVFNFAIGYPF